MSSLSDKTSSDKTSGFDKTSGRPAGSRAPADGVDGATKAESVLPFDYPRLFGAGGGLRGMGTASSSLTESWAPGQEMPRVEGGRSSREQPQGEAQQRLEQARGEGEAKAQSAFAQQLQLERAAIASALAGFDRERESYFHQVEAEVVQLALAIARKVVHREVEADPLLLAAVVRVALEKVGRETKVTLFVHPSRASVWHEHFFRDAANNAAAHNDGAGALEIVADSSLALDQCRVETAHGSTEIGIEKQLKEIELGFADLLALRPARSQS